MQFLCDSNYIVLPVNRRARMKSLRFFCGNEPLLELNLALDETRPDFFVRYDVRRFKNKMISVRCEPDTPFQIRKADTAAAACDEALRPKIHFTAHMGWLNDPNGLVYYDGLYHMFFQHNPVGTVWSNMHWGHAVSRDLMHWKEKEIALFPDKTGTMFSGSAIVDSKNLLGLKNTKDNVLVLFYTAAGGTSFLSEGEPFTQCMAYSADGGKTFEKYAFNPIIEQLEEGNRDPKVIYHEASKQYIMALYLKENKFLLLSSSDLKNWTRIEEITLDGDAECADFYPLPLDNNPNIIKWVFTGASDRYIIGEFDGRYFHQETAVQTLHRGKLSYASQSWSNAPDNRRIRISWNRFEIPAKSFNMCMTIPCEMSLRSSKSGMCLCAYPVRELQLLYDTYTKIREISLTKGDIHCTKVTPAAYDILFEMDCSKDACLKLQIFGMEAIFNLFQRQIVCCGESTTINETGSRVKIRLIADTTGLELFMDDGAIYMLGGAIADYHRNEFTLTVKSGEITVKNLEIHKLKSI